MKNVLTTLLLLSLNIVAAQNSIQGIILDWQNDSPIEYATVTLNNSIDSTMLDGVVSNEAGKFEFKRPKVEQCYLAVQFMGYATYYSEVFTVNKGLDLGIIRLEISGATLSEIEVSGRAITNLHTLDKQVFDAGQFQQAKGGTASDVMNNLPSVSINSFGEISVRGTTGFLLMINGKPVQSDPAIVLQQLSANAIEDIEIITAPSAKYDPDGNAGIINIKTKRGLTDGLFITANVLVGLPSIESYNNTNTTQRYGADASVSYKKDRWDISAGLDYRRYDRSGRREGYVNTIVDNVLTEFPSDGERSFDEENIAARLSTIFTPDKRQSITLGFYAGKRTKKRTADILYNQQRSLLTQGALTPGSYKDLYQRTNNLYSQGNILNSLTYFNENLRVRKGDFLIGSLDYSFQFSDESSIHLSGLYERTILGGPTDNVSLAYPNTSEILQLQFNENDNPLDGIRLQVDFQKPLGATLWESGYQYRYLKHPGDFNYVDRDLDRDIWVENPTFTNSINLTRGIHSLYSQFSGSKDKWQYSAGFRLEYFDRQVTIAEPAATFKLDRFNLFPSFTIGYEVAEGTRAKVAYSKRIARTTTFKMTPFPEREHSETLEQGDAKLLPEYIDLVEAGLVKNWEDNTVFATAYYRHIDNVINRVNTIYNDTILSRIYTNAGKADVFGVELGTTFYPAKAWRVYLGANVFDYRIKGRLFEEDINTSTLVYSINANTSINFSSTFTAQLAFNYLSERVTAQGQDSRFYNPSLSLRKTFLDKKIALALQWKNIDLGLWDANEQRITTERNNFYTTTNYVYEVDIVQLTFTYQLNQATKKRSWPESEFGKKEF